MALGPLDRHRLEPHPQRVHLTDKPRPDQTKDPTGLESPPHRRDNGLTVIPIRHNQHQKPTSTGLRPTQPGRAKNRG